MLQVVTAVASSAPAVYRKANDLAKKVSGGRSLKDLVAGGNGPALTGELLVKAGLPLDRLRALMDGFAVAEARGVYEHAARFVQNEVTAVSNAAVQVSAEGVSPGMRDDIIAMQIHDAVKALGLRNASELMKVATVIHTLTVAQVQMYKSKGLLNPKLGYN